MSHKQLSDEQKLHLRNKAKAKLSSLQKITADTETKEMINAFKEKYLFCEAVYKVILKDYEKNNTNKNKSDKKNSNYPKVNMIQVPSALNYAGYDFDKEFLDKIFGSKKKKGEISAKKIRDNLSHELSHASVNELKNRYEEINGYLDEFLSKIQTFDSEK